MANPRLQLIGAALAAYGALLPADAPCALPADFAAPEAPRTLAAFGEDLLPGNQKGRTDLYRTAAFDATIYGMSAYLQYEQLYRQVFDTSATSHTGFNRFTHERKLAGPDYATFKVPNTDTLYSTAWIDLSRGPVEIDIPATDLKYFTLNIFDIFGNPSNLSSRTIGTGGGRFLLVPPRWQGTPPPGLAVYRAATIQLWILMRVFAQTDREVTRARAFQDRVQIVPPVEARAATAPALVPPAPAEGSSGFLRALDYILRTNGAQPGEEALVSRFRILGVGDVTSYDGTTFDAAAVAAIKSGYDAAVAMIAGARSQLGKPTGTGWMKVNKGAYGFNYVRRAVTNTAGLGANVREENASYTTFEDGSGKPLDGAKARYRLRLVTPPPVNAFWSVTLYDSRTFALSANPINRYLVSDRTPGLKTGPGGSIEIDIQHEQTNTGNWLPAPAGPFFVVIRAYSPKPPMLNGDWLPPAIEAATATP